MDVDLTVIIFAHNYKYIRQESFSDEFVSLRIEDLAYNSIGKMLTKLKNLSNWQTNLFNLNSKAISR